jgi:hypothetical protein
MVPKNLDILGCVSTKNMKSRMCIPMKIPKWQGTVIKFPAPITHRAWKRVCVKNVFFLCFLKAEIRSCFSRSSSPEPLFLPATPQISRSKAKETTCSGKNGTFQNHMTIAQKITTNFNAKK